MAQGVSRATILRHQGFEPMNNRSTTPPSAARALLIAALLTTALGAGCTFDDDDSRRTSDDGETNNAVDTGDGTPDTDDNSPDSDGDPDDVVEDEPENDADDPPDAQDPDECPDLVCELPGATCSDDTVFIVRTTGEVSKNGCSCVFNNLVETFESCPDSLEGSRCSVKEGEEPQCLNLCPDDCPSEDACLDSTTALVYPDQSCDPLQGVCPNPTQITCAGNERCVNGACRQNCAIDDDCQDNVACATDGSAVLTLTEGTCIAGSCQFVEDRLDCGDGFQCVGESCEQSCDDDSDCPVRRECNEDGTAINTDIATCLNNVCSYGGPVPEFCGVDTACTLENGDVECR